MTALERETLLQRARDAADRHGHNVYRYGSGPALFDAESARSEIVAILCEVAWDAGFGEVVTLLEGIKW